MTTERKNPYAEDDVRHGIWSKMDFALQKVAEHEAAVNRFTELVGQEKAVADIYRLALLKLSVTKVVHVLECGLPLCRFSRAVPRDWPDGHYWEGRGSENVTCGECVAAHEALVLAEKPQNPG